MIVVLLATCQYIDLSSKDLDLLSHVWKYTLYSSTDLSLVSAEVVVTATRASRGSATTGRVSPMAPAGFQCSAEAGWSAGSTIMGLSREQTSPSSIPTSPLLWSVSGGTGSWWPAAAAALPAFRRFMGFSYPASPARTIRAPITMKGGSRQTRACCALHIDRTHMSQRWCASPSPRWKEVERGCTPEKTFRQGR